MIYVNNVIHRVKNVQIKVMIHVSAATVTEIILIILQIFISVQLIVVWAITMIN